MPFEPKKGSSRHDIPNKKTSFFVGTILVFLRGRFVLGISNLGFG